MKPILTILAALLLLSCITTLTEDDVTTILVKNMTNFVFDTFRVRETGATNWLVTRSGTYSTGDHEIFFYSPLDKNKRYDLQLEAKNNLTATKFNVQLSENGIVTYTINDFDDDTSNNIDTIHIKNDTGVSFNTILIGLYGSQSWIVDKVILMEKNDVTTITGISPPLNKNNRYIVQLLEFPSGNITATKNNLSLSQNGVLTFDTNDLD